MNEGQIKHLELIQGVITRMAQNSFAMKGWAVTLVSAILVVGHEIAGWEYLLIALLPAFVFWGYDAYYLRQEKLFRMLYDEIRMQPDEVWKINRFTVDARHHSQATKSWFRMCRSSSVVWLYLPIVILIIFVTIYTAHYASISGGLVKNGKESVLQLPLPARCNSSSSSPK
jgi:hypothetical protein